ncbi:MAG: hypothetical protein WCA64_07820 [Gallionella sp.]
MSKSDRTTIKIRAYAGNAAGADAHSNLSEEQDNALELVKRTAQLQEERNRSLEYQKAIAQLQECLKQEQARTAELENVLAALEARLKELAGQDNASKLAELEARVSELTDALGRISEIAAAREAG